MSEICIDCKQEPGRKRMTRGLCYTCYVKHRKGGTLESVALPARTGGKEYRGDRWIDSMGYVRIRIGDKALHEHRVVMEKMIGRPLLRAENVHHRNGDRADNRPENLELWFAPQPYGQRVQDLMQYIAENHADAMREILDH